MRHNSKACSTAFARYRMRYRMFLYQEIVQCIKIAVHLILLRSSIKQKPPCIVRCKQEQCAIASSKAVIVTHMIMRFWQTPNIQCNASLMLLGGSPLSHYAWSTGYWTAVLPCHWTVNHLLPCCSFPGSIRSFIPVCYVSQTKPLHYAAYYSVTTAHVLIIAFLRVIYCPSGSR